MTAGGREADDTVGVQAATAASHGIGPTGVGVSGNISTAIRRGLAGVYTLTPHTRTLAASGCGNYGANLHVHRRKE